MLIGLDFDNTIVCYDQLFHRLALERGLIPDTLPATKQAVRDSLRSSGREADWTELQGIAYGPRITDAKPFAGVLAFLRKCRTVGKEVVIISHKTKHPYLGEKHDLHSAAHNFLATHGFYETLDTGLAPSGVFLEPTLGEKMARIGALACDAFVDDLPEVLMEPRFPSNVTKILFDPADSWTQAGELTRAGSWNECTELLFGGEVCV